MLINRENRKRGFTLLELLVVMSIVIVLVGLVLFIIDPVQIQRGNRDSERLADLANLNNAISNAVKDASDSAEAILCKGSAYPCSGSSYPADENTQKNDGTGWIKVDLTEASPAIQSLYIDPTNDSVFHFSYCADNDNWELNTTLESEREKARMVEDQGDQNAVDTSGKYEIGTNLTLINSSGAPCSY